MSFILDDFMRWWMLLSKVPYMTKEEVARKAFYAGQLSERNACISTAQQIDVDSFGIYPERAVQVIVAYQDAIRKRSNTKIT